ncbi:MAG: hypothetical protein HYR96_14275 [Deltaproteobacteria bacterium]|nr:hypothetical protein [Deltaproteobacteria bacterium]MBI3296327.1 hypothetical protein [Deltaproteobacteria bacterium]
MGRRKKNKEIEKPELSMVTEMEEAAEELSANEDSVSDEDSANHTQEMLRPDEVVIAEDEAPKKRRRSREKKAQRAEEIVSQDGQVDVAAVASKSLELMVKPWEQIRSISDSIVANLGKISQQMQEIAIHAPSAPAVIERQAAPKVTLLNRITLGVSAAALVLGLVGLTLSQNLREQLIRAQGVNFESASAPARVSEPVVALHAPMVPTPESLIKKPSELSRRQKEIWRSRRAN